jgi:hypothetical protein
VSSSSTDAETIAVQQPRLSVNVVSINGEVLLSQCLSALTAQVKPDVVEVLVVADWHRSGGTPNERLKRRFPDVRWIEAPAGCTVPRMRSLAMNASRGEIVALLEDDCVVETGWCDAVLDAHCTTDIAIGGAVEPGPYRRALDWAVYFCEYGRFMLPLPSDGSGALPGNNVAYKRSVLSRLPAVCRDGFYDVPAHWAWQQAGLPMRCVATVVVRNVNSWSLEHVTNSPYHHGRAFAAQRFADVPVWRRAAFGVLALFLPVLKVVRIVRDTFHRRRLVWRLVQALPLIALFTTSWSVGESVGCMFGPGNSPSKWR